MREFIHTQPPREYSPEEMRNLFEQLNDYKRAASEQLRAADPNNDPEERLTTAFGELAAAFARKETNDRLLRILEDIGVAPDTAAAIILVEKALLSSSDKQS